MPKSAQKSENPPLSGRSNGLHIRELRFEDIVTVAEIEKDSYSDPWPRKVFEREMGLDFSHFFVGEIFPEIVVYAEIWHIMDEAQLTNITVAKHCRRHGIGAEMLKHIINFAKSLKIKKVFLEVRESNLPAIMFYRKIGFNKIDIRKKYYSNSDDAVIMGKYL